MKNILVFVSGLNDGGITNLLKSLFFHIDRSKFQIDLVTYSKSSCNDEYFIENKCNIFFIPSPTINYFKFNIELNDIFQSKKYDAVHSHNMLNSGFILKSAKKNGVKIRICHSHASKDFKKGIIFSAYKEYLKRMIIDNSTILLTCSDLAGKYLFGSNEYFVFENSIDAELFSFSNDSKVKLARYYGTSDHDVILGAIGMMWGVKNHKYLLEIMYEIVHIEKKTHYKLVLCGDGVLRDELKMLVSQFKLEKNVIFAGWIKNNYEHYSYFDIYLMPSLSEGFPLSLIEAQASGCACIVSDSISKTTKLTNQFEFCPIDKIGLKTWIRCIINKSKKYSRDNEIVGSKFDSKINVKKLEAIYNGSFDKGM